MRHYWVVLSFAILAILAILAMSAKPSCTDSAPWSGGVWGDGAAC
jgi:hypothetical protein